MKTFTLILCYLLFTSQILSAQNMPPTLRLACESEKINSAYMQFPTSDSSELGLLFNYKLKDTTNEPFKNIISQKIFYSNDDLIIIFVAAEDSKGNLGVYRVEVNNSLKISRTIFINSIPLYYKNMKTTSGSYASSLFYADKDRLLYPSNEAGLWKLIRIKDNDVVGQWNHVVPFQDPKISDTFATWTYKDKEKTYLYIYSLKTEESKLLNLKDDVYVLGSYKNELYFVNTVTVENDKKIYRVLSFSSQGSKLLLELDSSVATYANFLMVNNYIFFTSERKMISNKVTIGVIEAQLNTYDIAKNTVTQKIKYSPLMTELVKKLGNTQEQLLNNPIWNQGEIIYSLGDIGGIIKYNFVLKQWFYFKLSLKSVKCFNPSATTVSGSSKGFYNKF
ncbi:MAG: hypothetical protein L6Q37_00840 [Bdellovibrionaceae bacterium]|nr:hypothetical protein [Pseudobdellovibrionaceae bacterium]NUM58943.1 hypothetical protein [Pseudobdellovibrionaceae bacterium]